MAYALVGSLGAPVQTASGAAVSGLAYGQAPTSQNLLVCWWLGQGTETFASSPSGWTQHLQAGRAALLGAQVFYKLAAGNDAVPSFPLIASTVQTVMLGEFSGNTLTGTNAPLDQKWGSTSISASTPFAPGNGSGPDGAAGDLVIYLTGVLQSSAQTQTCAVTLNNGATSNDVTNNGTSTVNHYDFGWGITTSNGANDSISLAFTTANLSAVLALANSFLALPAATFSVSDPQATRIPGIH